MQAKRKIAELEQKVEILEKQLHDCFDVVKWTDQRAPDTADLPSIMTLCTPLERAELFRRAIKKIGTGEWVGARNVAGRPIMTIATELTQQHTVDGTRKTKSAKGQKQGSARATILVAHIVLIGNGHHPTERRNYASHICHKSSCVDPTHLRWESANENNRRERLCRRKQLCICGQQPPCDFALHKKT